MKKSTNGKNQKKNYVLVVIGAATAVSLLIVTVLAGILYLVHPAAEKTPEEDMLHLAGVEVEKPRITKKFLTKNKNSRPGKALKNVRGIVIHYTGNPNTDALANRDYFESRKDCPDKRKYKVSSHYIIGLDGTIIQCIPEKEIAYASNWRNKDTISIECCHPDKTGKFTDATYQSVVWLAAYLCKKYGITEENIIRHYDVTRKMCPKYYVKYPEEWDRLKKNILFYGRRE